MPRTCLCAGGDTHPHYGRVTAGELADLVELGEERAEGQLRTILLMGVALAVVRSQK